MAGHGDAQKGIIIITIAISIIVTNMSIKNNSPRLVLAMVEMEQIACPE